MIKIAYVIDTIETAGAGTEKQLLMLLNGLDRQRFEATVVCLRNSPWLEQNELPCAVHILGLGSVFSPSVIRAAWRFRRLHRDHGFDIVQTFFVDANLAGTVIARFAGIRRIISSRRNIGHWHTWFHRTLLRWLRHITPRYLSNSRAVLEHTVTHEKVPQERIEVIYNGLDAEGIAADTNQRRAAARADLGLSEDELLVVSVANLRPVKNIASLVAAAVRLRSHAPQLRFVVLGEGPDRTALEATIQEHGLQDVVALPGSVGDVRPYLAAADIAVQCSLSESFSNALIEYMAAGLAIVAADIGGNGEAVIHQECGLLYTGTDGENLSKAIARLVDEPSTMRTLGREAQRRALERFSVAACMAQHEAYYEQFVREHS